MPSFYDLPLLDIVEALYPDPYESPTALSRLCRASKPLAALATRHLYRHPNCTKWWLLARTLLARPDLAAHVRFLADGWDDIDDDDPSVPSELLAYRDERLRGADVYLMDLQENRLELMLSLCPNISYLEAIVSLDEPFARCPPGFFPMLEEAWFSYSDTEFGIKFSLVEGLATAAPNLRRLTCSSLEACGVLPHIFPLVTQLRLLHSTIGAESLRHMLAACPNVTIFSFDAGGSTVGQQQFTPREAQDILAAHATQLKALSLDMEGWLAGNGGLIGPDVLLSSLAFLGSLETLRLHARSLMPHIDTDGCLYVRLPDGSFERVFQGEVPAPAVRFLAELLPASVRSLEVVQGYAGPRIADLRLSLLELASVAGARFPRLRRVIVSGQRVGGESIDGGVKTAFEARNIQFEEAYRHSWR